MRRRATLTALILLPILAASLLFQHSKAVPVANPCATATFNNAPSYSTGTDPRLSAVGDLNLDGYPDLVVSTAQGFSILLNDGAGGFSVTGGKPGAAPPGFLAVGDFNGDGKPDVAVSTGPNEVPSLTVFNGDGHGGLSTSQSYSISGVMVVADYNADGIDDLAIGNGNFHNVYVLLGSKSSALVLTNTIGVFFYSISSIDAGDLNGDGRMDLIVVDPGGATATLMGNGAGNFSVTPMLSPNLRGAYLIKLADFNKDGKADFVTKQINGVLMDVVFGDGQGGFPAKVSFENMAANNIVVGDFNRDGNTDFAVSKIAGITEMFGDGKGGFSRQDYVAGQTPVWLTVSDFNKDSKPDLAVVNSRSNDLSILLGDDAGVFAASRSYSINNGTNARNPSGVVAGDFNRDGRLDVAASSFDFRRVAVLLGDGNGSFNSPKNSSVSPGLPSSLAVGDFNHDGILDLPYTFQDGGGTALGMLRGNGDGTFQLAGSVLTANSVSYVTAADFNNDGLLDLAYLGAPGGVAITLGKPDGNFTLVKGWDPGLFPVSITTADLNGDGNLDLLVPKSNGNSANDGLWIGFGDGQGGISSSKILNVGSSPRSVAVGDFDGNGKPDFAVGVGFAIGHGGVSIFMGDGNGNFTLRESHDSASYAVAVGDFNGDGKTDLATTADNGSITYSGSISVLIGLGTGSFSEAINYGAGMATKYVVTADLNGDGKSDIIAGNASSGDITVMLTAPCVVPTPTPTPTPLPSPSTSPTPFPSPAGPPMLVTQVNSNRAVALDSVTLLRDPLPSQTVLNFSSDHRTRIVLFAWALNWTPNPTFTGISVQAQDAQARNFSMPIEHVEAIAGIPGLSQVTVRLPDGLTGDAMISVTVNGITSNKALVTIN